MNRIENMLQELCPDGVEVKRLGDIGTFIRGNGLQKKDFTETGVGCIHYGQLYTHYGIWATQTKSFVSENLASKLKKAKYGDLVIATTSENVDDVCKAVAWLGDEEIAISGDAYIFRHSQNPKYLSYLFQTEAFFRYKRAAVTGTKVMRVSGESMERFEFPIPPLEVQKEIVRILDNYTKLQAELQVRLQEELQARKEQYEFYRNKLLTFDKNNNGGGGTILRKKMGEFGTFVRGNGLQKKDFVASGVGCIHYGQIYTHYGTFATKTKTCVSAETAENLKRVETNDLVIACTSENLEDVCKCVAWLGKETIVTGGHASIFKHKQNAKYLSYYFQTKDFFDQKRKFARGTKVIEIKNSDLEKIEIPLPSLEEQQRIVTILDKFETLVNDLTQGLPAEIAAVREQYEYYRNKLLTFPPAA